MPFVLGPCGHELQGGKVWVRDPLIQDVETVSRLATEWLDGECRMSLNS